MDIFLRERGTYRFGPFDLDPTRRVLTRHGERVKIAERLFDMLLYLVVNQGRLIERDELLQATWGDRIVEENNLAQAIHALRRTLQDGGATERYIVTTPGRGYRFAAHVVLEPEPERSPPEPEQPAAMAAPGALPLAPPQPRRSRRMVPALLAIALILIGIGIGVARRQTPAPAETGAAATAAAFAPPAHSVAVLAFENMTGDPGQTYFSDGVSEELIDSLSRLQAIQVAARTSAFSFKGSRATIDEIARKLNVGAVLEGSVQRHGAHLRIATDLVDARSGLQIWSRTYERDGGKDDPLTVQGDIATSVASALEVRLAGDDDARLTAGGTHDPRALDAYLRGATIADVQDDAHYRAAVADYDKAIALDPAYALAYVGRATALDFISSNGEGSDAADNRAKLTAALADIDHAIALAPMLSRSHIERAHILLYKLDFRGELAELQRALDLSPGSSAAESSYGVAQGLLGHFDRALPAVRHAIVLDPLAPRTYRNLARVLYWQRKFEGALDAYQQAAALDPRPSFGKRDQAVMVYLAKGNPDVALRICEHGDGWSQGMCLAIAYHALGRQTDAQATLDKLHNTYGDTLAYNYAEIYAQWNQPDAAVHWLQEAYGLRDTGLCALPTDPFLDPIRQRPEFRDIQARLDFPPDI